MSIRILSKLNETQIRRNILDFLYKNFKNSKLYVEGEDIIKGLNNNKQDIFTNLRYLEDKGLVYAIWRTGGFPVIKITSSGIDLIEDESEFNRKFPIAVNYDSSININNVTGDITGVGISGSNNIIKKITKISDSFNIKNDLSNLPNEYANAFKNFLENIDTQIQKYNINEKNKEDIHNSIDDLIKETKGVSPNTEPGLLKQQNWKEKFFGVLKNILPVLPKTAETITMFTPLAPFSKIIGNTVEKVVAGVQKEL